MATHRTLTTVESVIEKLGNIPKVSALTGRNCKAVWMWKYLEKFPANTYVIIKSALADKGFRASDKLWGMNQKEDA